MLASGSYSPGASLCQKLHAYIEVMSVVKSKRVQTSLCDKQNWKAIDKPYFIHCSKNCTHGLGGEEYVGDFFLPAGCARSICSAGAKIA